MLKEMDLPTLQSQREVSCVKKMIFEIMYGLKYVDNSMIPKTPTNRYKLCTNYMLKFKAISLIQQQLNYGTNFDI